MNVYEPLAKSMWYILSLVCFPFFAIKKFLNGRQAGTMYSVKNKIKYEYIRKYII